jgi:hypothetical protein
MIKIIHKEERPFILENESSWRNLFTLHEYKLMNDKKKLATAKITEIPFGYMKHFNIPLHCYTDDYSYEMGTTLDQLVDEENVMIGFSSIPDKIYYIDELKSWDKGYGQALLSDIINSFDSYTRHMFCLFAYPILKDKNEFHEGSKEEVKKLIDYYKQFEFKQSVSHKGVMYLVK